MQLFFLRCFLCFFILSAVNVQAQEEKEDWQGLQFHVGSFTGLNLGFKMRMLVGEDDANLDPSINGFGSGFLFDVLSGYLGNLVELEYRSAGFVANLGVGITVDKFRFAKDVQFVRDDLTGVVGVVEDNTPDRAYNSSFFSYGKSKLVVVSLSTPLLLGARIGKVVVLGGPVANFFLQAKQKQKFEENGNREKVTLWDKEFGGYNINPVQWGAQLLVSDQNTGLGVYGKYMFTPMFEENKGPQVNALELGISVDVGILIRKYTDGD